MSIQTTLMSGRFVFVNQALGGQVVDDGNGCLVRGTSSLFIGSVNRLGDYLQMGA